MNGKRCAIFLSEGYFGKVYIRKLRGIVVNDGFTRSYRRAIRIFGSHSEAKRELKKLLPEWPDAAIVDEEDL